MDDNSKRKLIILSDDELKQLQRKSLEITMYIINFCKERNIRVFLYAGSLLGAVRHQGFIPWDDDMDLYFPAPDFDKFVEAWEKDADTERYSLCLQTKTYNDHRLSASIRDNNTTFITDSTVDLDVNQGLSVEIDVFHACPKSRIGQMVQLMLASISSLFKAGRVPARQNAIIKFIARIILGVFKTDRSKYFMWHNLEKLAKKADCKYENAEFVREFTMFPFITWMFPRKWFDSAVWVQFEKQLLPIPIGAKAYLTKRYGNYMELPPEKDRHPEQRIIFMDLNTSYKKYRGITYFEKGVNNG